MTAPRLAPHEKTIVVPARPRVRMLPHDAPTIVKPIPSVAQPPAIVKPVPSVARPQALAGGKASPEMFALIRRIAIQRTLEEAAGVLHAGLASLIAGRVALAQISDAGAITSPVPGDLRDAAAVIELGLIAETSRRRQRFLSERAVMVPLPTTTRAVLVVWRKADATAFDADAIATATQTALRLGVLDHFLAVATEQQATAAADRNSVFRAEALAASREARKDGELVDLSPRILRVAIPAVILIAGLLVTAAAVVQVPSYSRGTVVVKANGHNVIASGGGPVTKVFVSPGQQVLAGEPLLELDTTRERRDFEQIDTNYRDQLSTFLFDTTDDAARDSLAGIRAQRKAAQDAIAAKTITAPVDGAVTDVLATDVVGAGEHVATIIPRDTSPSVIAFLPGADRSRFQPGMPMQIELSGYSGSRLTLAIAEVGTDIMGQAKARRLLGEKLADAVALPSSVVLVKASLPGGGFTSRGKTYHFFDGMDGIAEIEIDRRSFLSTIIPIGD